MSLLAYPMRPLTFWACWARRDGAVQLRCDHSNHLRAVAGPEKLTRVFHFVAIMRYRRNVSQIKESGPIHGRAPSMATPRDVLINLGSPRRCGCLQLKGAYVRYQVLRLDTLSRLIVR